MNMYKSTQAVRLIKQGRQKSLQTGRANAQRAYINQQEVQPGRRLTQEPNAE